MRARASPTRTRTKPHRKESTAEYKDCKDEVAPAERLARFDHSRGLGKVKCDANNEVHAPKPFSAVVPRSFNWSRIQGHRMRSAGCSESNFFNDVRARRSDVSTFVASTQAQAAPKRLPCASRLIPRFLYALARVELISMASRQWRSPSGWRPSMFRQ